MELCQHKGERSDTLCKSHGFYRKWAIRKYTRVCLASVEPWLHDHISMMWVFIYDLSIDKSIIPQSGDCGSDKHQMTKIGHLGIEIYVLHFTRYTYKETKKTVVAIATIGQRRYCNDNNKLRMTIKTVLGMFNMCTCGFSASSVAE